MSSNDDAHKLFVAALPESVTEDALRDLFNEANIEVFDVSIPRDRMTGRPRGFAFVRVGSPDDVERALAELHGHMVNGTSISVRRFNAEPPTRGERPMGGGGPMGGGPRGPMGDTSDRTLYVGNLPYDTTQEEVEGVLREAGADAFVRVHLPLDPEGRRRGFGFVTMATAEAAKAAVEQLKGVTLRARSLVVNAAQPKSGPGGAGGAPRGDRPFGGPPGTSPGGGTGGAAPANRFGPPAKPGGKNDFSKRKKTEGGEGAGGRARSKRAGEDSWKNNDDDD